MVSATTVIILIFYSISLSKASNNQDKDLMRVLELAIGPTSNTYKAFATICEQNTPSNSRAAKLNQLKITITKSFKDILKSNLKPAELMQNEFIKKTILATIESYSQICANDASQAERLIELRETYHKTIDLAKLRNRTNCQWFGHAPFCKGNCPSGYLLNRYDSAGDGKACFLGMKAYCCQ